VKLESIRREDGARIMLRGQLGEGGQGAVYLAECEGKEVALKWYDRGPGDVRRRIEQLIVRGAPSPSYIWPEALAVDERAAGFGYLMPLIPARYHPFVALMTGKIDPTFRTLCAAAINIARAFLDLHAQGLCYGDINFGNIFIAPDSGQVLVCDNDNVVIDGDRTAVLGTMRFMAPEIVRGEANPCADTDRWSLAVLLFYAFMIHHPLEGKRERAIRCMDLRAMEELYGHIPTFIFHPENPENHPDPKTQGDAIACWESLPGFLQKLFTRGFVRGCEDPREGRVRETEWIAAFERMTDSLVACSCGADNFHDLDAMRAAPGEVQRCWGCLEPLVLPPRVRLEDGRVILLGEGGSLQGRHLLARPGARTYEVMAKVMISADERIGLQNVSSVPWSALLDGSQPIEVKPGQTMTLMKNGMLYFHDTSAMLRA
jgi:DNA-binding helix-hairpin-helix protein with protein kinase domain